MNNTRPKIRKPVSLEKVEGGLRVKGERARGLDAERPLVSLITVCLNSEKHLARAIESVLSQTYANVEYIIVDGGSTDGTLDIIREYEDRISYWVSEPDEGIYDAMNKGISLATGDLVGIINSDDWYFPDAVQEVMSASIEDPAAQVFFGSMYIADEDGKLEWVWESSCWDIENFQMSHPTCFVRRAVYDDYLYRTKYRLLADYDLMLRLHLAGIRFKRLDKPLTWFRKGGASHNAYYRTRADGYEIRWDQGLLSPRRYIYKRLALVFKAPLRLLILEIGRRYFKEIDALRSVCGDLTADSIAMKEEIKKASAYIAKLEREIEDKNALIEYLGERVRATESADR